MSEDVLGTTGARGRARMIWVAVAALIAAAIGVAIALALQPGGTETTAAPNPTPSPTVTATPVPAAPPTEAGELDDASAVDVVQAAISAPISLAGTADDLDAMLENVAVDGYAAELGAQWLELSTQGWSLEGEPEVESVEVTHIDLDVDPAEAEVTACVDSSDVVLLDNTGTRIGDDSATTPRSLHLFSLVQGEDGSWRISAHSFPNNPTC